MKEQWKCIEFCFGLNYESLESLKLRISGQITWDGAVVGTLMTTSWYR